MFTPHRNITKTHQLRRYILKFIIPLCLSKSTLFFQSAYFCLHGVQCISQRTSYSQLSGPISNQQLLLCGITTSGFSSGQGWPQHSGGPRQVQFKWAPKSYSCRSYCLFFNSLQTIYKYSTVYACKYSINIVCKKHSKLFLLVYIVVSAGYSKYYHITMKVCLEL